MFFQVLIERFTYLNCSENGLQTEIVQAQHRRILLNLQWYPSTAVFNGGKNNFIIHQHRYQHAGIINYKM